jgi:hypothetical protein
VDEPITPERLERAKQRVAAMTNEEFREACVEAGIEIQESHSTWWLEHINNQGENQ